MCDHTRSQPDFLPSMGHEDPYSDLDSENHHAEQAVASIEAPRDLVDDEDFRKNSARRRGVYFRRLRIGRRRRTKKGLLRGPVIAGPDDEGFAVAGPASARPEMSAREPGVHLRMSDWTSSQSIQTKPSSPYKAVPPTPKKEKDEQQDSQETHTGDILLQVDGVRQTKDDRE
ncbi:hypothetical protein M409DRAFT_49355 [Zasmidium cellare ATCC 36951]|uniref:Uncharacterized protein n=1 Tax=Zasmidium cellare ATCC 36951 TaxID=1080233 RepID=A0A6A6D367_ZASCE|nr:uncharacterized protein M409DRAFT_49355 [Zasmidium cellare ATCC 36951]KAF2172830.1 hypothetical protein M409DRAFT_49355 [Zasmidium cellare ATCC 36951]